MSSYLQHRADSFLPTRQSLLSRLKNWDDQESWREFFDTYGELIYNLARRAGLSDSESQDAVQETLIAVVKQMPGFQYDPALGSFKGWLAQITRRRIVDQLRRRRQEIQPPPQENAGNALDNIPDPAGFSFDALWEEEWQKHLLQAAMRRIRRKVHPKQFQMFDLYVSQQLPMKAVTEMLGVTAAQVYMAKMRLSRMLKAEIRLLQSRTA